MPSRVLARPKPCGSNNKVNNWDVSDAENAVNLSALSSVFQFTRFKI